MSERIASWWQSTLSAGAPVFPYVGLALLILLVVLAVCVALYLAYRLCKRLPPIVRHVAWRTATLARRLAARRGAGGRSPLVAAFAGSRQQIRFEHSFSTPKRWNRLPAGRRPPQPLFLVVGPAGSGKSALLRTAAGSFTDAPPSAAESPADATWWQLKARLALEIHPSLLAAGAQARLSSLLHRLARFRPDCPLDGVVVTLPAAQLASGGEGKDLDRMAEALARICVASGHRIPVYVVVTGAEQWPGFRELATATSNHTPAVEPGWLNAHPFVQFDPEQAVAGWLAAIRTEVLRSLTSGIPAASFGKLNPMLHLPAQAARLQSGLVAWLKRCAGHTAHGPCAPVFRGIFLTGLAAPEAGGGAARMAFCEGAARALLFAEEHLAQPTVQHAARGRRRLRIAAAALAGSAALLALWMPLTLSHVRRDADILLGAAQRGRADIHAANGLSPGAGLNDEDPARQARLLAAIAAVDDTSLVALLAPASWFDDTRARLLSALGDAVQRLLIEPRLRVLANDTPRLPPELSTPVRGAAAERVEELPGYAALRAFLGSRELANGAARTAETMPEGVGYQDLVRFLGDDPQRVRSPQWDWRAPIPGAAARRFDTATVLPAEQAAPLLRQCIAALWQRLLQESLDFHPVMQLTEEIGQLTGKLARGRNFSHQDALDLNDRLRRLQRESDLPDARRLLGKPADAAGFSGPALALLGASAIVPMTQAADAGTAFGHRREALRRRLLALELEGVGHLFVSDPAEGTLGLTPELKRFAAAYGSLLAQPFMQRAPAHGGRDVPGEGGVTWNLAQLAAVKDVAAALREYGAGGIQSFDPGLRPGLMRLAQAQSRTVAESIFWNAAQPEGGFDAARNAAGEPSAALRRQAGNVAAAVRLYRLAFGADDGQGVPAGSAGELLLSETQRLLARFQGLLDSEDPYGSMVAEARRWMVSAKSGQPLGSVMRGNPKERLALARDYMRSQYAGQVAPLLEGYGNLAANAPQDDSVQQWRRLMDTLDGFDKNATANGLYEFEQYVLALSKWSGPDDCARLLAERAPPAWRSDYFSRRLAALDEQLTQSCAQRTADGARRKYADFADWFNAQIAGHPPFGGDAALAPLSRRGFTGVLARYRDLRKQWGTAPPDWPQPVLQFLGQMDGLSERFGPTDQPKTAPAGDGLVQARLQLRSNRGEAVMADQVIEWTVLSGTRQYGLRSGKELFEWRIGEPLELRLRWAAQSPYIPVAAEGQHYSVAERTVIFRFGGDWAFFDLLRRHTVRGDGYDQALLRFPVTVAAADGRRGAQLFLTFSAPSEHAALALDFPPHAPAFTASEPAYFPSLKLDTLAK